MAVCALPTEKDGRWAGRMGLARAIREKLARSDEDAWARGLLGRVAGGDEDAFEALYARYAQPVLAFVVTRCPDRGLAEEVAADTWLGCWRSARAFRGDSRVLTWLLGIARRQLYVRVRGVRMVIEPLDTGSGDPTAADELGLGAEDGPAELGDPESLVLAAAGARELDAAVACLTPDLREVVTLAWLHDLPYEEIARVVGVPVGTVKSRVFRARRLLRERLRGSEEDHHEN